MNDEISSLNMCRACMKVDGVLLPMYGNCTITEKNFPDKLADLASIRIEEYDGLPNVLCTKCAYRTEAFHEFKLQVRATEKKLRKMFELPMASSVSPKSEVLQKSIEADEIDRCEDASVEYTKALEITAEGKIVERCAEPGAADECSVGATFFDRLEFIKHEETSNEPSNALSSEERIFVATESEENPENWQNVDSELTSRMEDILETGNATYTLLYIADGDEVDLARRSGEELPARGGDAIGTGETDEGAFFDTSTDDSSLRGYSERSMNRAPELGEPKVTGVIDDPARYSPSENTEEFPAEPEANDREDFGSSDNSLDPADNLLGSLNDTITRIREIKTEEGDGKVFQCTLCMETYDKLTGVLGHTVDTHVPKSGPFFCVVCEKDCSSHRQLRSHVKNHTGKYPYSCFVCNKAYSMKRYLKRHMSCHTDLPRHRCPKCGERFNLKADLEAHLANHVYTGPAFACSQCPRVFNHKGNYKRHLVSHLDPRGIHLPKYPCEVCGKRFINNRTLQTHMRVHTGEKPFECDVCKRSFSQRGNLLNHQRIHSNPRSYTCEVCGKRFNQRATLRDHGLLHTGEKPYVCNVCGVAFTFSAALRRHLWSHATDKPFGCEICNARFVGKYDIKRHMKIHTDRSNNKRTNRPRNRIQAQGKIAKEIPSELDPKVFIDEPLLTEMPTSRLGHTDEHAGKENVHLLLDLIEYG